MFGLGVPEIILIMAVALIVFGPKRLPEIGRTLGKTLGEFKKATDDFKNTIEREVRLDELKQIGPSLTSPIETVSRTTPAGMLQPAPGPIPFAGVDPASAPDPATDPAEPPPGNSDPTIAG